MLIIYLISQLMISTIPSLDQLTQIDLRLSQLQNQIKAKIDQAMDIVQILKKEEIQNKSQQSTQDLGKFSLEGLQNLKAPQFKLNENYRDLFWQAYLKNQIHLKQVKFLSQKTEQLQSIIYGVQRFFQEYHKLFRLKNRKKNRRLAVQIQKTYTCPYEKCHKIYGSDVSLNLHIKLKHNGGNKTDRQKLAEQICRAQQKAQPMPNLTLNLPPGYLNEYKKLYFQRQRSEQED